MRKNLPLLGFFTLMSFIASSQSSARVVISQVYGGAGCTTTNCSTYGNDFIEIYNRSSAVVTLTGYSVQYASAAGASGNFSVTSLPATVTLQPGQYYLITEGGNANGINTVPAADVTGTISMSATAGKVALVSSITPLAIVAGGCPASMATVVDFIGYGTTANCFEGAQAPAPSTTTADTRIASGTQDGNNNSLDFLAQTPAPRNTASPLGPTITLPITLHYFSAVKRTSSIDLKWKTLTEENAAAFDVERSNDGSNFATLTTLVPAGRANEYLYTDNKPFQDLNYYRLKLVSRNGNFSYSPIIQVKMAGKNAALIYPNPASKQLVVQFTSGGQEKILVQDLSGRVVKTITVLSAGIIVTPVDVSDLSRGAYFITIGDQHLRFVKL